MSLRHKLGMALGALAVCALLITGCASNDYTPTLSDPQLKTPTIGEADTLRVGVNTSNPPLAGMGSDKIIGIDVDIAAAIADNLGLKLSVVDVGSDPVAKLKSDEVDIVMGVDSDQTYEGVWLSESYLPTGIALFSMEKDAALPEVSAKPKFAAQRSSRSAQAVINEFGEDALSQTSTLADAFADLEAGKVDYVAADAIMGQYAAHTENINAYIIGLLKAPTGYAVAVNQSNGILRDTIEEELQSLSSEGIIDIIELKWLDGVVDLEGLPQTAGTPLQSETEGANNTSSAGDGAVEATTQTEGEDGSENTDENGTTGNSSSTGGGTSSTNSDTSSEDAESETQ